MSKLIFLSDPSIVYEGKLSKVNENVIRLEFKENIPDEKLLLSGLNIINEHNGHVMTVRIGYDTVYRKYEDNPLIIELSNDGSVWVKPFPKVTFRIYNNGSFEEGAKLEQEVYNYEELVIPTVLTDEGYNFIKWTPEIPPEGEIEKNITFTAVIEDKNIYFHCSGGGHLDGEIKQFAEDYSELTLPSPVPDKDYKFVGWMPEIPDKGIIENTNFYAVFESNIPDRLTFVENDLTDTQLGLVENFDFTMSTAEEVTDLQMALVELYDMFLLQIAE